MHTTAFVTPAAFRIISRALAGLPSAPALLPRRFAIISPDPIDAVCDAGYLISACVADHYRQRPGPQPGSCNYPEHELRFDRSRALPDADLERIWGNLDIWPSSRWTACAADAFLAALPVGVDALLWPAEVAPPIVGTTLRARLLEDLGAVWLYGTAGTDLEIHVESTVEDLIRRSLAAFPRPSPQRDARLRRTARSERYRRLTPTEFLDGAWGRMG